MNEQINTANPQESVLLECSFAYDRRENIRWMNYIFFHSLFSNLSTFVLLPALTLLIIFLSYLDSLSSELFLVYILIFVFFIIFIFVPRITLIRAEKKQRNYTKIKYSFCENNFIVSGEAGIGNSNSVCDYRIYRDVIETKHAFYLRHDISKNVANILPKAQLTPDQTEYLRGFFAHKFGKKFKSK